MPCETPEKPNAALKPNHGPISTPNFAATLLLHDDGVETLGVLDVDGLDVAVKLLLGALLVVAPPRDADAESIRNALDTLLPDLLVQLGIQTDIRGALCAIIVSLLSILPDPTQVENKTTACRGSRNRGNRSLRSNVPWPWWRKP